VQPTTRQGEGAGAEPGRLIQDTGVLRLTELRPGLLLVSPHPEAVDSREHARRVIGALRAYGTELGRPPVVVALLVCWRGGSFQGRGVYAEVTSDEVRALGLVASSSFARVLASLFLGLGSPVEVRTFESLAEARAWAIALT
jgi:hypothetical protein